MDTAVGLDDIAHFSDLQGESSIFEWLLHLFGAKGTEIPAVASGAAVRELFCELGEFFVGSVDLSFVTSEYLNSFSLRTGDFGLGEDHGQRKDEGSRIIPDLSPARRVPAPGMFHQEVASPNLCGPVEVFSSRKLRDLFVGEAIGCFPD